MMDGLNKWRFTGFYVHSSVTLRNISWQLLLRLSGNHELNQLPWLVGGDFDEILFDSEKKGGLMRAESQMMFFADECGLHNIPARGDPFTWCNMRQTADLILVRLDRFVCSFGWQEKFQNVVAENLGYFWSDHRPVLLRLSSEPIPVMTHFPKRFTFEHKWFLEDDFNDIFSQ